MSKKKHGAPVETWPRDIPGMREDHAPGLDAEGRGVWAPEYAIEQAEEHCPVSCEAHTWAPWGTGFTVRDPSPSACPRPAPALGTWRHPETRAALRVRIAENAAIARAWLNRLYPPREPEVVVTLDAEDEGDRDVIRLARARVVETALEKQAKAAKDLVTNALIRTMGERECDVLHLPGEFRASYRTQGKKGRIFAMKSLAPVGALATGNVDDGEVL